MKNKDNPRKSFSGFTGFLRQREQKIELLAVWVLFAVIGVVFYILYPFPFTFPDSGSYVMSASEGMFNVYRPTGYSTYLSIVNFFGKSTALLFVVSYLLSALSMMFLLFSAKYLMGIRKWFFRTLCLFAVFSPRIIFSTNFIMSDGLFNTLTMLFLATALWMVYSRSIWMLAAHLLTFIALYQTRYSGMSYIPVSVITIYLSYRSASWAKRSIALLPLVVFVFLFTSTKSKYVQQTGVNTFSAFSGWQLINNASVLFPEAKELPLNEFPREMHVLHQFLCSVPDSVYRAEYTLTTKYMWDNDKPYKIYMMHYMQSARIPYSDAWVRTGKLYGDYAGKLISQYPGRYFTRFIWPSFKSNFVCRSMYEEEIVFNNEPLYRDFFGITVDNYEHKNHLFASVMPVRKVMNWLYWIGLGLAAILFLATISRSRMRDPEWQCAALMFLFLILYFGASVVASPNTTWRYTMPMFVPSLVFMFHCAQGLLCKQQERSENIAY